MLILGIDTSGKTASIALLEDNLLLAQNSVYTKLTHSQVILPMCKKLLKSADKSLENIDIFAVADGPGSYTGLRIGISAVKAMCFALNKKCIGISSLEAMAYGLSSFNGKIIPIMKARQNLLYSAVFESNGHEITRLCDDNIIEQEVLFNGLSDDTNIMFTGDAAEEFCSIYNKSNFYLAPPHLRFQNASGICMAAQKYEPISPDMLDAKYLQVTKAEKDLQEKNIE